MPDIPIHKDLSRDYSPRTIIAYRSRLKTLKLGLEVGAISEQDKPAALREIAVLEKKLGDRAVSPGQGRPRKYVKLTMAQVDALREGKELADVKGEYTEAQQEVRRLAKQAELLKNNPELAKEAEERSQRELEAMQQLGGDKSEGSKATDDPDGTGKAG